MRLPQQSEARRFPETGDGLIETLDRFTRTGQHDGIGRQIRSKGLLGIRLLGQGSEGPVSFEQFGSQSDRIWMFDWGLAGGEEQRQKKEDQNVMPPTKCGQVLL